MLLGFEGTGPTQAWDAAKQTLRSAFSTSLEGRARELLDAPRRNTSAVAPSTAIRDEIALVLDALERWRALHRLEFERLLDLELALDSELLNLPPFFPAQCTGTWRLSERLQDKLQRLEETRRELRFRQEERTQALNERLLASLLKLEYLEPQ